MTTGVPSTRNPTVDAATVPATTARRRFRAASAAIGTTATTSSAVPTRDDLGHDREHEREVGEHDGLRELTGLQRVPYA